MLYGTIATEAKRLAVLSGYEILDSEPETEFDEIALLASHLCNTPIALVVFIDECRQWFKAHLGLDVTETPRTVAFCHYTIQGKDLFIVRDALLDSRFKDNPLVTSEPKIRFYAGAPLTTKDGHNLGTLCVIDTKPRDLTEDQKQDLKTLARQVLQQLELRRQLRQEETLKKELETRVAERTRELSASMLEAQAANRMKTTFIANMSHEIRTPLGAIMGFSELMADPESTPHERKNFLEIIKRNGDHLQTVIDDILDISKIEAGALKIEKIPFSPRSMIQDLTQLLQLKALEKDLALHCSVDPSVPSVLLSDPHRLQQILMNLIDNAIKFTEEGEVRIHVKSENPESHQPRILFEISDTGLGLSPEQASRLFKAFSQADESVTRKHGGTGLGLALSRRLAQLLGGDVRLLQSRPHQGSTFLVTIQAESVQ